MIAASPLAPTVLRDYVTPKRCAPVAAQRELLLASCTTEHHVHLGGGGGYRPQRVGFTLFGLSSGRRAVLAMRLYLLTMCPSPNSARLSCAQRNADVALAVAPDVLHRCCGAQVYDQWDSFGECPLPFRFRLTRHPASRVVLPLVNRIEVIAHAT